MSKNTITSNVINKESDWVTIREAIRIVNQLTNFKITDGDIYRHALYGNIFLTIYFQSSIILRKIKTSGHKVKLRPIGNSFIHRLCLLDKNCFMN
ncbi:hypothetical protein ACLECX_00010 [Lonsdalea quercina]|uniref:hypothetical protein n=1 Tax=Lonsdalea quercina TaxID=71657 RepID=UPI003976D2A0